MSYCYKRIPVLFAVLVFVLLSAGCGGKKNIIELSPQKVGLNEETEKQSDRSEMKSEVSGTDHSSNRNVSGQETASEAFQGTEKADDPVECVVHICGAVNHPGVYAFPAGSRIYDAVREAGGLCEDAAERQVNQAALLTDGMQIVIPTLEEAETMQAAGAVRTTATAAEGSRVDVGDGPVNINAASVSELMTLPGIGQSKAEAILSFREKNGAFGKIEDIMKVDGIGEASFQKLKSLITV